MLSTFNFMEVHIMKLEYLFEHNTWLFEDSIEGRTVRIRATNITSEDFVSFKISADSREFFLVEVNNFNMTTDDLLLFCLNAVYTFDTPSPTTLAESFCRLAYKLFGVHNFDVFCIDNITNTVTSYVHLNAKGPISFKCYRQVKNLRYIPIPQIWWNGAKFKRY